MLAKELKSFVERIEDERQAWKVEQLLGDIVITVLCGTLANANRWVEIAEWAKYNEPLLKRYLPVPNGTASHDTIERVMSRIRPETFQGLLAVWRELLSKDEGRTLKTILAIDGKTIRGNGNKNQDALQVVSAWSREHGVWFGQKASDRKGKELPMIKALLEAISVKGHIVTIDAIGTQKEIVKKITEGKGNYVLAVQGNQPVMHEELQEYFADKTLVQACEQAGNYRKDGEKARGQLEQRE